MLVTCKVMFIVDQDHVENVGQSNGAWVRVITMLSALTVWLRVQSAPRLCVRFSKLPVMTCPQSLYQI
ncbi:MAG: hypothetical protein QGH40_06165 [bacterium]|nr:hypothetical protein [bacterium]